MKASDIIWFKFMRSRLGSDPRGIDVTRDGPGEYKAFDRNSTEEAPIAVLRVEGGVITSLEIEEGNDIGPAATALIKALCDDADAANRILLIHPESMVGLNQPVVSRMETDRTSKVNVDTLSRLAGALGMRLVLDLTHDGPVQDARAEERRNGAGRQAGVQGARQEAPAGPESERP